MKILDFLFYYLTIWFQRRTKIFKKMNPIERVTYGLGISTMLWVICIDMIVEYFIFNSFKSIIPNYIFVVLGLFFMWLFKYIYITKKRYERILKRNDPKFNVAENTGIIIAIIFVFSSLLTPMLIAILLHKINGSL